VSTHESSSVAPPHLGTYSAPRRELSAAVGRVELGPVHAVSRLLGAVNNRRVAADLPSVLISRYPSVVHRSKQAAHGMYWAEFDPPDGG